jgi:hypothetical protein
MMHVWTQHAQPLLELAQQIVQLTELLLAALQPLCCTLAPHNCLMTAGQYILLSLSPDVIQVLQIRVMLVSDHHTCMCDGCVRAMQHHVMQACMLFLRKPLRKSQACGGCAMLPSCTS